MGRGLGPTQRFVLAALEASSEADPFAWVSARALAKERAQGRPSRAQIESINRALRTLARRGLAEVGFVWTMVPTQHPVSRTGRVRLATAAGRRPPTADQIAQARREQAERIEELKTRLASASREAHDRRGWPLMGRRT